MNRRLGGLALLGLLTFIPATAPGEPQDAKKAQGTWTALFDGTTLSGWEKIGNADSKWEVAEGAICGSGPASMLVCDKGPYKNFRVRAEIKINDKGNSGLYVRSKRKPGFTDGYEIQINSTHGDPVRTGSLYTLVELYGETVAPDTWYTQEVEVRDRQYRGKTVTEFTIKVNDKILYKFRDFAPEFKEGHIAFQQHDPGSKVCIRKVEVMELP
jgi:Domain of Unknown Function (DUF1080)